ncbi:MAG: SDR family NAD(P)-dependent oxidoreductase [candidate division Zixibacteria bacterium]|jgi:NADP-dependent 3-hydroxy acid dehydrogenase YdfG|nr:SDR family NAD(P)-dependent oxidoreductase [candidate division Zixibacteria bacterium]
MSLLKDKIVLVTGASSGIGEASALRFSREGARVIISARRRERLEKLAGRMAGDTHAIALDVRDAGAVKTAIDTLPDEWREIDILVNNAGLARGLSKLHEGDLTDWNEMIDTNIKGLLHVSRAVIPGMVKRGRGHVINIGSIAGHWVYPNGNVYCATKFAVNALTQGMTIDLVDTPVRVSTVDPGLVETEFSLVRFRGQTERAKQTYQGYTPLTGDDIADAVVWVASRPPHVQVQEIVIMPTAQAHSMVLDKRVGK